MSKTFQVDEIVEIMAERIASRFDPDRIILFGSRARGDARPNSDVDLLVVLPVCEDRKAVTIAIMKTLADLPVSKDVVVTSAEDLETRSKLRSSIFRPALREGILLYAR